MDQKVKLQISSDLEDVTRVASVLLEEALLHIKDLAGMITAGKESLKDINISNPDDLQKLKNVLRVLNTTKLPVTKIDNRLGDVVAIVDGLDRVLNQKPEEQKEEVEDDSVTTG